MSKKELSQIEKSMRYWSVYGASIAADVHFRMQNGYGAPSIEKMKCYIEEAHAIATLAEEAENSSG